MKKTSLILILVLSLAFIGLAENPEKPAEVKKQGLQIKPKIFGSILSPIIFNLETGKTGFTIVAADTTFLKCKKFYFIGIGVGVVAYMHEDFGLYYDRYWGWRSGRHFDQDFRAYLKLTPVKYYIGQKLFGMKTYAEIGLTLEGKDLAPGIAIGLTFSGNPFKKKKRS